MKKFIIGLFFLALGVNAQDIKGGFKISPNFSTFSTDVENESKGNIGYGIGYFETMDLNSNLALQGEINYTHYAYETGKSNDYQSTIKHKCNIIEIPVILKYKVNNFGIGFGVQYGYGLGSNTTQTTKQPLGWGSNDYVSQTNSTDSDQSNDLGYLLDLSTTSEKFTYGLRYYMGSKKGFDGNSINSINLSIGYILF